MINLISSLKDALNSKNWYAALTVTLTLPDIAGKIDFPTETSSRKRYADWFGHYIQPKYITQFNSQDHIILSGDDCYALRCSYLHEGSEVISHQKAQDVINRFEFFAPNDKGIVLHGNQSDTGLLQLQIDLFCLDIFSGIENWMNNIVGDVDKQQKLQEMLKIYQFDENSLISFS